MCAHARAALRRGPLPAVAPRPSGPTRVGLAGVVCADAGWGWGWAFSREGASRSCWSKPSPRGCGGGGCGSFDSHPLPRLLQCGGARGPFSPPRGVEDTAPHVCLPASTAQQTCATSLSTSLTLGSEVDAGCGGGGGAGVVVYSGLSCGAPPFTFFFFRSRETSGC